MCCPQGQLEKSKPSVKEVTERPSHGQELNPTSKMLWELEVTADIEYALCSASLPKTLEGKH